MEFRVPYFLRHNEDVLEWKILEPQTLPDEPPNTAPGQVFGKWGFSERAWSETLQAMLCFPDVLATSNRTIRSAFGRGKTRAALVIASAPAVEMASCQSESFGEPPFFNGASAGL